MKIFDLRNGETRRRRNGESLAKAFFPLRLSVSPSLRLALPLALLLLNGCGYYSFTGATLPEHLNTVAIPLAEDNSLSPLTTLDEALTELLVTRFVRQTRLSLETSEDDADAVLTATIDRYTSAPTSVTACRLSQPKTPISPITTRCSACGARAGCAFSARAHAP